jgi:hypothetical protein
MSDDRDDDTDEPSINRRERGAVSVSPKTLVFAAALFLGGGVGGGGLSFAAKGIVPEELSRDLAETRAATDPLKAQMVQVQAALVRIEANSGGDKLVHDTLSGRVQDHEERIRLLERKIR